MVRRPVPPDSEGKDSRVGAEGTDGSQFLGDYQVMGELGRGGMARVYLARLDRPGGFVKWVAIKRIRPLFTHDADTVEAFLDEARIAASINNPYVAQVIELGEHEGSYWLAMEYLHGESLREILREMLAVGRPLPADLAARVIADAAEGLHAAHELRGDDGNSLHLVHRDVTPHNIFVTYDGQVKIVDFGIARIARRLASTDEKVLKGRLAYMSPEQARGDKMDRRTDIFSLGIVMWEMVTGSRLFGTDDGQKTLENVQRCEVPSPSKFGGAPFELEAIILRALRPQPDDRYPTAQLFSRELRQFLLMSDRVVGPDELGVFMKRLFAERMREREATLQAAGEVTGAILSPAEVRKRADQETRREPAVARKSSSTSGVVGSGSKPPVGSSGGEEMDDEVTTQLMMRQSGASRGRLGAPEHPPSRAPRPSKPPAPPSYTPSPRASPEPPSPSVSRELNRSRAAPRAGALSSSDWLRPRAERRRHMRHFACFPAEVEAVRGRPRSALIRDLSISGAALLVRVKLVVGTPLRLGLFISRETDEPVVVRGRVVRVKSCGPAAYFWAYRVAVKFDHPVTEHEAEIQAIAREQERVGVAR